MYYYSSSNKDRKTKKKLLLTALVSFIPFAIIIILTLSGWESLTKIDYQISQYIYGWHSSNLDRTMTVITHLGDAITQTIITFITLITLFIFKKWRTALWYGLTVLAGALLLNGAIKEFYMRARPSQIEPLVKIGGYSFPSGHSMGSMIVYGGLLFLIIRLIRSNYLKTLISLVIATVILLVGFSRVYLAVHFPSDVIGGFSLGLSWLTLSIALFGLKYTNIEIKNKRPYSFRQL